jgi:hypothetical protein
MYISIATTNHSGEWHYKNQQHNEGKNIQHSDDTHVETECIQVILPKITHRKGHFELKKMKS